MAARERAKLVILEYIRNNPGLTCLELAALAKRAPVNVAGILGRLDAEGLLWVHKDRKSGENRYWPAVEPSKYD